MTLVEGFDADAVALARLLAGEGREVTLAGAGPPTSEALALRALGVDVRGHADLDRDPGEHDEAFLDVWTPEVAPRVGRLRAAGAACAASAISCWSERAVPTVGVTGTAGKTTTALLLVQLLRMAGVEVHASASARAGNLWPTAELLPVPDHRRARAGADELASLLHDAQPVDRRDHVLLARPPGAPRLARALPGREGGDRRAGSRRTTSVVANEEDEGAVRNRRRLARAAASGSPRRGRSRKAHSSAAGRSCAGRWGGAGAAATGRLRRAAPAGAPRRSRHGARGRPTPTRLERLRLPELRSVVVGHHDGVELVDDGMAATPAKTACGAARASRPIRRARRRRRARRAPAFRVHASPEEQRLLGDACEEARRAARLVVLFGPAAGRLAPLLDSTPVVVARRRRAAQSRSPASASPAPRRCSSRRCSPLSLEERERIAPALRALVR